MFAQVDRLASEITYVGVGALRVKASLDPMGERAGGGGGVRGHLKGCQQRDDWTRVRFDYSGKRKRKKPLGKSLATSQKQGKVFEMLSFNWVEKSAF